MTSLIRTKQGNTSIEESCTLEEFKQGNYKLKSIEEVLDMPVITVDKDLEFSEEELKIAYLFYLMNKGYTYEEKIIKSDVSDKEYAYVSENNSLLDGFNTKLDWERVYLYGDTFKSMLGTVSTTSQGIPYEDGSQACRIQRGDRRDR